jgi:hypothetical protein
VESTFITFVLMFFPSTFVLVSVSYLDILSVNLIFWADQVPSTCYTRFTETWPQKLLVYPWCTPLPHPILLLLPMPITLLVLPMFPYLRNFPFQIILYTPSLSPFTLITMPPPLPRDAK